MLPQSVIPLRRLAPVSTALRDCCRSGGTGRAGPLLIADSGNNRVRVVANRAGTFYGAAMTAGDIYTVAGTGKNGFAGDGGPATAAQLSGPAGAAADVGGGLVINDAGNSRYREVTS